MSTKPTSQTPVVVDELDLREALRELRHGVACVDALAHAARRVLEEIPHDVRRATALLSMMGEQAQAIVELADQASEIVERGPPDEPQKH